MNYFAHGRRFIDDPYFLSGTAVPDWLSVVNRRIRARAKSARQFADDSNPEVASVARGVIQHHHDDGWFHQTLAFTELSLEFTLAIRDLLQPDDGFRPSFLGHILVELLLDAALIEADISTLDAYYLAIDRLDVSAVAGSVARITGQDVQVLEQWIPRFSRERFLYDYLDDAKLLTRLNHVMRRVQLPLLPPSLSGYFPHARQRVKARQAELLAGET